VSFWSLDSCIVMYNHHPSPDALLPVRMTREVSEPSVAVKVPPGWYSWADGSLLDDTLVFTLCKLFRKIWVTLVWLLLSHQRFVSWKHITLASVSCAAAVAARQCRKLSVMGNEFTFLEMILNVFSGTGKSGSSQ